MSKARVSHRAASGSGPLPGVGGDASHDAKDRGDASDRKSGATSATNGVASGSSGGEAIQQIELARRLAITDKQVRNLTQRGVLPRNPDRSYPWPQAQKEYIKWKQDEKERRNAPDDDAELNLNDEQAKLTVVKREMAELDLAERLGELIDIHEVEDMLRITLEQVDAALKNASSRYATDLAQQAGIKTPAAMKLIDQIVERIRADIRLTRLHVNDATAAA